MNLRRVVVKNVAYGRVWLDGECGLILLRLGMTLGGYLLLNLVYDV